MHSRSGPFGKLMMAGSILVGLILMVLIEDRRTAVMVFLLITWAEATCFIVLYGFRSNWRATAGGRAMFWLALTSYALITWVFVAWWGGNFPFRDDIREFMYMAFAVAFFNVNLTLTRVQGHYPDEVKWRWNPFRKVIVYRSDHE